MINFPGKINLGILRNKDMNMMNLLVRIKEIKGHCPVYEVNDSFKLIDGYKLVAEKPLCMHALAALTPYYNALRVAPPEKWGLAGKEDPDRAYVQCPDAEPYTDGGTVVFEISREDL
jgi:uncharacterized repeat protein (TIGR04076 family)